jgi:protein gp37
MAKYSNIDYLLARDETEEPGGTWSPWLGCCHAGAGCAHCWAEEWASRFSRFRGHWGKHAPRYFFGEEHWRQPHRWQRKCERLGVRKRVLASLCDPFEALRGGHPQRHKMIEERLRLLELIELTPRLDWLLLTKRPENIPAIVGDIRLPNLWLGVSAWDQPSADRNISPLLEAPAALHWVSFEPLLGPVEICNGVANRWSVPTIQDKHGHGREWTDPGESYVPIDWVVVGCESQGARPGRPCEREWVHSLVGQCRRAEVPMFTKQLPDALSGRRLIKSAQLAREGWPVELPR